MQVQERFEDFIDGSSFDYNIEAYVGDKGERSQSNIMTIPSGEYMIDNTGSASITIQVAGIIPEGIDFIIAVISIPFAISVFIGGLAYIFSEIGSGTSRRANREGIEQGILLKCPKCKRINYSDLEEFVYCGKILTQVNEAS